MRIHKDNKKDDNAKDDDDDNEGEKGTQINKRSLNSLVKKRVQIQRMKFTRRSQLAILTRFRLCCPVAC
jgi:hypothetical protein